MYAVRAQDADVSNGEDTDLIKGKRGMSTRYILSYNCMKIQMSLLRLNKIILTVYLIMCRTELLDISNEISCVSTLD